MVLCYKNLSCLKTVTAKIEEFVWDLHKLVEDLAIKCVTVLPWCATCSCCLCGHFAGLIRSNRGFNESYTFPRAYTRHSWLTEFSNLYEFGKTFFSSYVEVSSSSLSNLREPLFIILCACELQLHLVEEGGGGGGGGGVHSCPWGGDKEIFFLLFQL